MSQNDFNRPMIELHNLTGVADCEEQQAKLGSAFQSNRSFLAYDVSPGKSSGRVNCSGTETPTKSIDIQYCFMPGHVMRGNRPSIARQTTAARGDSS